MPNFKLRIDVDLQAHEYVVIEADDETQAYAALEAYVENGGPFFENLDFDDTVVRDTDVTETEDEALWRAVDWLV